MFAKKYLVRWLRTIWCFLSGPYCKAQIHIQPRIKIHLVYNVSIEGRDGAFLQLREGIFFARKNRVDIALSKWGFRLALLFAEKKENVEFVSFLVHHHRVRSVQKSNPYSSSLIFWQGGNVVIQFYAKLVLLLPARAKQHSLTVLRLLPII